MTQVLIPDIGDFEDVEIIELLVDIGDSVVAEQPLLTLESDKATMEIPAPADGTISKVMVAVGERVSEGSHVMELDPAAAGDAAAQAEPASEPATETETEAEAEVVEPATAEADPPAKPPRVPDTPDPTPAATPTGTKLPHASPAVRRFARELGADLTAINGSGPSGRILKQDVKDWTKGQLSGKKGTSGGPRLESGGMGIPAIPEVDFSKFGETETVQLSRIQRISGPHLHRAWLNIPHVTHHDESDVTELEAFRKSLKSEAEARGVRVTMLAFIMKAVAHSLQQFPAFNASLSADGQSLIYKKYFNIGVAVDTPDGLVVPVIREINRKSVFDLGEDLGDVSTRARDGKLKSDDLQGGCISISSLGGIGGTAFTPVVNAPEVAILGVSRAKMTPVWDGSDFQPRLMLPLDLSYDHRVIDGASAARFTAYLAQCLSDIRRILL